MNVPRPETPKPEPASAPTLASPVTCVWGVGSERATLLAPRKESSGPNRWPACPLTAWCSWMKAGPIRR
jgi:hypothetical protein